MAICSFYERKPIENYFCLKTSQQNHFLKEIFYTLHKLSKFCGNSITFHDVNLLNNIYLSGFAISCVSSVIWAHQFELVLMPLFIIQSTPKPVLYIKSRKQDIWFVKCIIYLKTRTLKTTARLNDKWFKCLHDITQNWNLYPRSTRNWYTALEKPHLDRVRETKVRQSTRGHLRSLVWVWSEPVQRLPIVPRFLKSYQCFLPG